MSFLTENIVAELRAARLQKGLSQRELSAQSGVPQSHISKIESGSVDLRVSSLIALARVLGLELFLASKRYIPAVQAIIHGSQSNDSEEPIPPAYQLDDDDD